MADDPSSQAWPPPPPAVALLCPRCGAPAQPAARVQRCDKCRLRFVLQAGPFLDRAVVPPPPDPQASLITVRSGGFIDRYGGVDADGVLEGALDPVLAKVRMTTKKIAFRGVYTVAVWRRIPWAEVLAILLVPVPFTFVVARLAWKYPHYNAFWPAVALAGLTLAALGAVFLVRANFVRVVGAKETFVIRFDRPLRRRKRFHAELLRRCGLAPTPIP